MYFYKIENFAYGDINERSFSYPHPWTSHELSARGHFTSVVKPKLQDK